MGTKYLPTVRDQKASLRFQQKQNPLPGSKQPATAFAKKDARLKAKDAPAAAPEKPPGKTKK